MPSAQHSQTPDLPRLGPNEDDAPPSTRVEPLGMAAGRGISWLSVSFIAGKAFSFLAQIILGRLLLKEDFGIFAIAIGVASFAKVFQDGGVSQILIQRGPQQLRALTGPAFWMGLLFSLGAGLLLALAAPVVAAVYDDPRLTPLLWVIAASLPLNAPAQFGRAALRITLRFRALALINSTSFAVRHFIAIALALTGFGAMSFVLPLLAVAVFENLATQFAYRGTVWRSNPTISLWGEMLKDSGWIVATTLCYGIMQFGDYLVLGYFLPKSVVGLYYFGYQLTAQLAALFAVNVQYVLLPVLSRLASEPERQVKALMRTLRVFILVLAPCSLGFAVVIEPLEQLIWGGKWSAAVPLMQVFAVAAPLRMLTSIIHTTLNSRGQFSTVTVISAIDGIIFLVSAGLAAAVAGSDLTQLALVIGGAHLLVNLSLGVYFLNQWGVSTAAFFGAILPGWLVAVAAAAASLLISQCMVGDVRPPAAIVANAAMFSAVFLVAMRALYSRHFEELVAVLPVSAARTLRCTLFLRQ